MAVIYITYQKKKKLDKNSETQGCYTECITLKNLGMVPGLIKLISQYVRQTIRNPRKETIGMLALFLPLKVTTG